MPKFRVKKSLSKITRTFEAHVEPVETDQDLIIVMPDEELIHMFDNRRNPEGSYVLRFGANNF